MKGEPDHASPPAGPTALQRCPVPAAAPPPRLHVPTVTAHSSAAGVPSPTLPRHHPSAPLAKSLFHLPRPPLLNAAACGCHLPEPSNASLLRAAAAPARWTAGRGPRGGLRRRPPLRRCPRCRARYALHLGGGFWGLERRGAAECGGFWSGFSVRTPKPSPKPRDSEGGLAVVGEWYFALRFWS